MTDDAIRTLIVETLGDRLAPSDVTALARAVAAAVKAERLRCARVCHDRAALWRTTSLATSTLPQAREEARARANEAAYLADVLEIAR